MRCFSSSLFNNLYKRMALKKLLVLAAIFLLVATGLSLSPSLSRSSISPSLSISCLVFHRLQLRRIIKNARQTKTAKIIGAMKDMIQYVKEVSAAVFFFSGKWMLLSMNLPIFRRKPVIRVIDKSWKILR